MSNGNNYKVNVDTQLYTSGHSPRNPTGTDPKILHRACGSTFFHFSGQRAPTEGIISVKIQWSHPKQARCGMRHLYPQVIAEYLREDNTVRIARACVC